MVYATFAYQSVPAPRKASPVPTPRAVGDLVARVAGSDVWLKVPGGATAPGLPEAPVDTFSYGRLNGNWERVLPLSGGTLLGPLTLAGDAGAALAPVSLQQMTAAIAAIPPPDSSPVVAANVAINPAIGSLGANVQTGLAWLDANHLPLAGGTVTGPIGIGISPPTSNLEIDCSAGGNVLPDNGLHVNFTANGSFYVRRGGAAFYPGFNPGAGGLGVLDLVVGHESGPNDVDATGGFLYISACPGEPTGIPIAVGAGRIPLIADTAKNALWALMNGAWRVFNSGVETEDRTLRTMASNAARARLNNPRINPAMTAPPTITATATVPARNTNTWGNVAPKVSAFNFYGGVPTMNGANYLQFNCVTVNGGYNPFLFRVETVVDAAQVTFSLQSIANAGTVRFIVDGQYVSLTPLNVTTDWNLTLDFTTAGGRAVRSIIMEGNGSIAFGAVSVSATETISKPQGVAQRMIVVGDSFGAAGGATSSFNGFPHVLADLLGIRDVWNSGVGGTGYLNNGGTQTTFRGRLSDLVTAAPDVILIVGGHNDGASTPTQLQAEVTAYLAAIRAEPTLVETPVIVSGVNGANIPLAQTQPLEDAINVAVFSMADPLIFFMPDVTNPAGPYMTGTGNIGAPTGFGNCDIYIDVDTVHPNDAGHDFFATMLADNIQRVVLES